MRTIALIISFIFCLGSLNAQTIAFNPRTGDVEMDGFLKDINTKATENVNEFIDNVSAKFNTAKDKVKELLKVMAPGDVYMTAQTAEIVKKPVDDVATAYNKSKDKGWGQIAKELGIKPGSPEFHALKKSMKGEKGNGNGNGKGNGKGKGKNK